MSIFIQAQSFIIKGFTKGVLARDITGCPVNPRHDSAVCWCTRGAIAATLNVNETYANYLLEFMVNSPKLANWNDNSNRDDVIHLFDIGEVLTRGCY